MLILGGTCRKLLAQHQNLPWKRFLRKYSATNTDNLAWCVLKHIHSSCTFRIRYQPLPWSVFLQQPWLSSFSLYLKLSRYYVLPRRCRARNNPFVVLLALQTRKRRFDRALTSLGQSRSSNTQTIDDFIVTCFLFKTVHEYGRVVAIWTCRAKVVYVKVCVWWPRESQATSSPLSCVVECSDRWYVFYTVPFCGEGRSSIHEATVPDRLMTQRQKSVTCPSFLKVDKETKRGIATTSWTVVCHANPCLAPTLAAEGWTVPYETLLPCFLSSDPRQFRLTRTRVRALS